ncbi:MAG: methylenetetrahydrofolate--tRNA-(uracil(54)-C(5))-methyltransferase (FADH(2)-oxidizing) TrmFO [Gemmatimonadaceae bacterium]|nr:methylenetetrahydrofolate--tRNA-(uracil(54)-C(5))-methyltransferase (FADH(2)-oxidizing) TrmFO [Gemmatimonadaceae bacterium]
MTVTVHVVGGGLAGSEAAFQLAERGHRVVLHEMRGVRGTAAHQTDRLAELVCSNTFKSTELTNAHGLLKAEMRLLGSVVLEGADVARVAAGSALAVDRDVFSATVSDRVTAHPLITVTREEVTAIPDAPCLIATGPLTSDALAESVRARLGVQSLAFYDAIAPIVSVESVDQSIAFRAARWNKETMPAASEVQGEGTGRGAGDGEQGSAEGEDHASAAEPEGAYLNCPMDKAQYEAFLDALTTADQFTAHEFDSAPYFEGCMPVEEMARRGRESLRFGPMKPIGLRDPRTGRRPWAVVQLRREDRAGRMWNLVGCQTRLRIPEQQRVFRLIPGLEGAEFLRFGSIHRNTYLNAPAALTPHLSLRDDPQVLFAGQLTGVEGYTESTATGLLAAINLSRLLEGNEPVLPPPVTMLGALYRHLREADPAHFQPMNANFGLLEELAAPPRDKMKKRELYAERSLAAMREWMTANGLR